MYRDVHMHTWMDAYARVTSTNFSFTSKREEEILGSGGTRDTGSLLGPPAHIDHNKPPLAAIAVNFSFCILRHVTAWSACAHRWQQTLLTAVASCIANFSCWISRQVSPLFRWEPPTSLENRDWGTALDKVHLEAGHLCVYNIDTSNYLFPRASLFHKLVRFWRSH